MPTHTQYRPLKIAPPVSELSMQSDSGNASSQSSSSSPSVLPGNQSNGSRSRGSQTVVACMACRKRKSKCSRERPRCSTCWSKRTECIYETEEGQTRLEHLRNINSRLRNKVDDMSVIIHVLQSGSDTEATEVLHRLRASQSLHDTVRLVRDSQLMLPSDHQTPFPPPSASTTTAASSITRFSPPGTGSTSPDRLPLSKEDSMDSSRDGTYSGGSTVSSSISSLADAGFLPPASRPPATGPLAAGNAITLPSLAALTAGHEPPLPLFQGSPSPRLGQHAASGAVNRQTLPPLSVSVGEVR